MVADRSSSGSVLRAFHTAVIWVTLVHGAGGIPWTQEKVRIQIIIIIIIKEQDLITKQFVKKVKLDTCSHFFIIASRNLPLSRLKVLNCLD